MSAAAYGSALPRIENVRTIKWVMTGMRSFDEFYFVALLAPRARRKR